MQTSLADFFTHLLTDSAVLAQLQQMPGLVSGMSVQKTGAVRIETLVATPFPSALLIELETSLEAALPAREVLISQTFAEPLPPLKLQAAVAASAPWLIRHLRKKDAFFGALLSHATFEIDQHVTTTIRVFVPDTSRQELAHKVSGELTQLVDNAFHARFQFDFAAQAASLFDYTRSMHDAHRDEAQKARAETLSQLANSDICAIPANPPQNGSIAAAKGSGSGAPNFATPYRRPPKVEGVLWGKVNGDLKRQSVRELNNESGLVLLEGEIFALECRSISNGTRLLYKFALTDLSSSVSCILFAKPNEKETLDDVFNQKYLKISAEISFDAQFSKDLQARVLGLQAAQRPAGRQDQAEHRRVELHAHTKMSTKDAVCETKDLVKLAARFGHLAIAITDHGVVQSFPDAATAQQDLARKGQKIKIIYGMEGYLVDDGPTVAWACEQADLSTGFIALDVETTGLDPSRDRVIELAAVPFLPDGQGGFSAGEPWVTLINPLVDIPPKITELTGITALDLQGAPDPWSAFTELAKRIGDKPVVAHNAFFDLSFIRYEGFRTSLESDPRIKFNPPLVDTLALARKLLPHLENHKLNTVAAHLGIKLDRHHRADDDARVCGEIFAKLFKRSQTSSLSELNTSVGHLSDDQVREHKRTVNHIILLASDNVGLYNLYRLVSESHTRFFHTRPRIPRSLLQYFRTGLILGSACENGEIFQAVLEAYRKSGNQFDVAKSVVQQNDLVSLARFYDYLEIQPITNNSYYLRQENSGIKSEEDLRQLNRLVVALGQRTKKPVCATCDVHFLERDDAEFRRILLADNGYSDYREQPDIFFRTTGEMLAEFSYLGDAVAHDVVITQPQAIADRISDQLKPFPDGSFPPIIASAPDDVRNLTWSTADAVYGREGQLPEVVRERIERELHSIIDNGFSVMYYIAHHLVAKSNADGYIVGSRGSVGSSLVATLCGITEVNPLLPHYICPNCHYFEGNDSGNYGSGYDLPAKSCPECGTSLNREGQDIPFETFLGFKGDKQPDIDLNFSGEYQARAHKFIEEMFGSSHTFRAGTISGFAEKNAQAMVLKYFEKQARFATQAEVARLSQALVGVKRTTGQHPGGIVVVPKERDIYDFTPIQHPADKRDGGTVTTHFDFNAMHDTILKLDVLGHDDPTMLKMLGDLTGVDVRNIPIPDERVMSLFCSTEGLGIPQGKSPANSATLGLPEMGTFMARDMIRETSPTRFFDLVQLMGLSHGTDVWKGNAQELIRSGTCTINDVIGCRDSIMSWLIHKGLPNKASFDIMEKVRKGKGLSAEHEQLMRDNHVPDWYIDSCKKIKYMFPKAHAAAYTISSLRVAWFKVYHPLAYYCAYFTVRADEFDSTLMCNPPNAVTQIRADLKSRFRELSDREQKIYYIIELVEEMQLRGLDFLPIDLYASTATHFSAETPTRIRPPLNAIPGISEAIAESIIKARQNGPFQSRDDLMRRAEIGQSSILTLATAGCLTDMPESAQLDLFSLLA
ncbi:MAG: PolC-type DNA polymerase III [Eubacteriales bacterium]|nr:PolC-type DNA polymerase III [Eubacteriales bacterium]